MALSRDNRRIALALLLAGVGDGMFFYLRPLYLKELGADPVAIGSILATASAVTAFTHIPAGYLADRFGRKHLILFSWTLTAVALLVMHLARSLEGFVAGLILFMFANFVMAPLTAYIVEARGAQSVQRALTMSFSGYGIGNVMSPAVGGLLGRTYGLRLVFGLAALAYVASTFVLMPLRPQPVAAPTGRTRYAALVRNQRFLGFLALMFLALGAMVLGIPLLPNYVAEVWGFDVGMIGVFGTFQSLGIVVLNLTLGQRLPRRGFMIAQWLMALSVLLLLTTGQVGWIGLAYFCQAGWNFGRTMALSQVRRVVEAHETGLAFGFTETIAYVVIVAASFAAGVLYQYDPALPFKLSLGLIALTLPLVWLFAPRHDAHTVEASPVGEASTAGEGL